MGEPYWKQRRDAKLKQTTSLSEIKREKKADLSAFYIAMAAKAPTTCENCNTSLQATINFHPRAHIAHIVPKGQDGCPSVATEPFNCWYACLDCHTFYDKQPADLVATMHVIPKLIKRLKLFYKKIADNEKRRIPAYLLESGKK